MLMLPVLPTDLSLLSRIPGRPYKEPADIKVERDDSLDRDSKDFSKQSSEKSSSKTKRKHKVRRLTTVLILCSLVFNSSHPVLTFAHHLIDIQLNLN